LSGRPADEERDPAAREGRIREAGRLMDVHEPESWRELDDALSESGFGRHHAHARSTFVFRGLAKATYSNVSSLARLAGDYAELERHLIRNFRKYAHQESPGPTTWDWVALGQHHGLPTRLLDWTFSPLVALHFATATWPDDDAVLWAVDVAAAHEHLPAGLRDELDREGMLLATTDLLDRHAPDVIDLRDVEEDGPFALFFEPPSLDQRIVNQAAVLSVVSDATCHMGDWLDEHPHTWRAWRISADLKAEVRTRLDQLQITERVLLPGLDGLAAYLRRYYSPRAAGDAGGGRMDVPADAQQEQGRMG
jgi:FRG domain-containing protein